MKSKDHIQLISSGDTSNESVLKMSILPGEKTPWHYHTLFSETFEILNGTLEVGKGKVVQHLKKGEIATININEKHYYHNVSKEVCVIKATLKPGNNNFEKSLFILKGLASDGLASAAGTPRKFLDLALFVHLSNSKMVGFQKIAEPLFNYAARIAIKKGYLDELIKRYC